MITWKHGHKLDFNHFTLLAAFGNELHFIQISFEVFLQLFFLLITLPWAATLWIVTIFRFPFKNWNFCFSPSYLTCTHSITQQSFFFFPTSQFLLRLSVMLMFIDSVVACVRFISVQETLLRFLFSSSVCIFSGSSANTKHTMTRDADLMCIISQQSSLLLRWIRMRRTRSYSKAFQSRNSWILSNAILRFCSFSRSSSSSFFLMNWD